MTYGKLNDRFTIACLISLIILPVFAADMPLSYGWEIGKVYHYETVIAIDGEDQVVYSLDIDAVVHSNALTVLSLACSLVPECLVFVSVDRVGYPVSQRLSCQRRGGRSNVTDVTFLSAVTAAVSVYDPCAWVIPSSTQDTKTVTQAHGLLFTETRTEGSGSVVFTVDVSNLQGRPQHVRVFDTHRGLLLTNQVTCGSGPVLVTSLRNISTLPSVTLASRVEEFQEAENEDAFRWRVFRPFLQSKDKQVRRMALFGVGKIDDPALRFAAYLDAERAEQDETGFGIIVRSLLTAEFKDVNRVSRLETLSGQTFGGDYHKWADWCDRIRKVFPDITGSSEADLLRHVEDDDLWVRDFALRQLEVRSRQDK